MRAYTLILMAVLLALPVSTAIAADEFGAPFGQDVPQALIDLARENDNIMLDYYDGAPSVTGEEASQIEPAAGGDVTATITPEQEAAIFDQLERARDQSDGHVIIDRVKSN